MGLKLMNCFRPDQVGSKEFGKMMKRIQVLEDVGSQQRRNWRIEEQKRRITRKEYHQRVWQMRIQVLEDGRVPAKGVRSWWICKDGTSKDPFSQCE